MNFSILLLLLTAVTGVLWLFDCLYARRRRFPQAPDPKWVVWGASFFPVVAVVFFLRSFIAEPFRIPSGSMLPSLQIGDFILVNKFAYGIRLPVLNTKLIEIGQPQRGDVMVFRYPKNPKIDYVKRVVGLPGDLVVYRGHDLFINGVEVETEALGLYLGGRYRPLSREYREYLGDQPHLILEESAYSPVGQGGREWGRPSECLYHYDEVRCRVPVGHYFVMGDNRDNSSDSRMWGFVSDQHVVGKAFWIWFHAESFFPPKDIDFSRIGSVE